jgi:hypothetical protein
MKPAAQAPADGEGGGPAAAPPTLGTPDAVVHALLWGLHAAMALRARSITCVSPQFAGWPWDDARLLAALAGWLRLPQRRLVLLATDYATMGRRFPRFEQWRRDWVHVVPAWVCPEELVPGLPEALFDDGDVCVQVFDRESGRGRAARSRRHRLLLAQQTDVVLQRSGPSWPAKSLGL